MNKVPFFDYKQLYTLNKKQLDNIFDDVGRRGSFILQKDLKIFENKLASYTGIKYAVGVGNATDALLLGLLASKVKKGSEIIISSHTMIATASAIFHAGCIPVPVDVGDNLMIDYETIEQAITKKTSGIMPTQLNGQICNMDVIRSIAKKYNLKIFEDASQALGAKYKKKHSGNFGEFAVISFYPAKNLGSLGDGGAILTNKNHIYKRLLLLRDHGRNPITGDVKLWGFNSRLDNLQAAFLIYFLRNYNNTIKRRRSIAKIYYKNLENINQITLPQNNFKSKIYFDVYQNFEIKAKKRNQLKSYLNHKGIGCIVQWSGKAIHQFKSLDLNIKLNKTDKIINQILLLPMNIFLRDKDIEYVCKCIKSFYKE